MHQHGLGRKFVKGCPDCRALMREYRRKRKERIGLTAYREAEKRWLRRRTNFIQLIKLAVGCVDCGYRENGAVLEFDHVNGNKEANISALRTSPLETLLDEIEKCEVRCANCHRIKTVERRNKRHPRKVDPVDGADATMKDLYVNLHSNNLHDADSEPAGPVRSEL